MHPNCQEIQLVLWHQQILLHPKLLLNPELQRILADRLSLEHPQNPCLRWHRQFQLHPRVLWALESQRVQCYLQHPLLRSDLLDLRALYFLPGLQDPWLQVFQSAQQRQVLQGIRYFPPNRCCREIQMLLAIQLIQVTLMHQCFR